VSRVRPSPTIQLPLNRASAEDDAPVFDPPIAGRSPSPPRPGTRHLATVNLLLENLTDGIILFNDDGTILDTNEAAERLFGEPLPIGAHPSTLAPRYQIALPDGTELPTQLLPSMRALRGETVRGAELAITRPDGARTIVLTSASPITVREQIVGVLLILHDISERVRREREAAGFQVLSQQLAGSELDPQAVYRTVVGRIAEITGARTVRLLLYEAETNVLRQAAIQTATGTAATEAQIVSLASSSLDALAARTRLPAVVPDFRAVSPPDDEDDGPELPQTGSAVAVPLIVHDELIGTLSYDLDEPHNFDDAEVTFLLMIATQSAIAIYNATLFQQRSRERAFLAGIIDHLPAGLLVLEVIHPASRRPDRPQRPDYRVVMLNALARAFLPPSLFERAAGRRNGLVGLRLRRLAADEPSRQLLAWLDDALARGDIVTGEELQPFAPERGPDASQPYWQGSVVPLKDRDGRVRELVLLATDVTEQVLARRRIEELVHIAGTRAAELEATVSAMTDAVIVCDAGGQLRLANGASLETYGADSLASLVRMSNIDERIQLRRTDGEDVAPDDRPLGRALTGETVQSDYTMFHHELGRDVHRRVSAAPVRDAAGQIIGAVAVETDITSLIEIDRLKDEFFSMAAHELRTPLTAIKGYAQILGKQLGKALSTGAESTELMPKALSTIREQSDRMERLINELLDVARIQSGQLELRYRDCDLVALVEQVVAEAAAGAPRHTIELRRESERIDGRWDRDKLAQVFANLLSNAIKYSPDGGRIDVQVDWRPSPDNVVSVAITDDGVGIAAEQIPRLFVRYSRVGDGTHYHRSGLGLGLYITKEIVDAHGGSIAVRSEVDHGSTFTVTLPLLPGQPPRPPSRRGVDAFTSTLLGRAHRRPRATEDA
jgi:signal transduction histidine kinase